MQVELFQSFASTYAAAFQTGITQAINAGLSAVADVLGAVLMLWVIIQGGMVITGNLDGRRGMGRIVRASLVALLLTGAGNYTTYVQQLFMTTLPGWIASAVNGSGAQASGAAQFDQLWSAVLHLVGTAAQQATGLSGMPTRIKLGIAEFLAGLTLMGSFVIWEITQAMMGLVVAIGPFVIAAFLFEATRGVADRWIGKLIGLTLLNLLVSVLLCILLQGDFAFVRQVQSNAGTGGEEQVLAVFELALFFGTGTILMVLLPSIAAHIGGGIAGSAGGIVSAAYLSPFRSRPSPVRS